MFHIIRPGTSWDFAGKRYLWLGFSGLLVLATLVLTFTKGLNFGIDFSGGAEIQIKVPSNWKISDVRSSLNEGGLKGVGVRQIGEPEAGEYIVRAKGEEKDLKTIAERVEAALRTRPEGSSLVIQRTDVVGPTAGSLLRKQGVLAMFYALLAILIYVAFRFDSRYAPGAVIALFHDSMIVLGVFILTQKQFDLTILAAMLALVGYSNNDTIIVYDRVRETLQMHPEYSIEQAVNRAVNETLGRTIVTSLTTFLVVASLFFFGGSVIHNFAFTLMIGVVVGTYSSVFIASSVIIAITHYRDRKRIRAKTGGTLSRAKVKA